MNLLGNALLIKKLVSLLVFYFLPRFNNLQRNILPFLLIVFDLLISFPLVQQVGLTEGMRIMLYPLNHLFRGNFCYILKYEQGK